MNLELDCQTGNCDCSSTAMCAPACEGCGFHSSKKLGKVMQRDLGSPVKWHARCWRWENRKVPA